MLPLTRLFCQIADWAERTREAHSPATQGRGGLPEPGLAFTVAQGGGGIGPASDQVDEAVAAGAVLIRPGADTWSLSAWASDDLLLPLQERRIPVICLDRMVSFEQVADLAGRYPSLPSIVSEIAYRTQRIVIPADRNFLSRASRPSPTIPSSSYIMALQ